MNMLTTPSSAQPPIAGGRLVFLDWVRIIAFLLLILYHVGMYYVTWDWHVKSPFASDAIEPFMLLTSPWRLGLLFLVSGVASSFMLSKLKPGRFMAQRSWRLLLPLVFGMLVIVPPQPYFEVVEKLGYTGSFFGDFMGLYLKAYHGFCGGKEGKCLDLPTWNHLWFVAYLWVYTLLLGGLMALLGQGRFQRWSDALARALTGWKLILLPVAVLAVARVVLLSRFPSTHALVGDWYNHAHYLPLFLLGALLARQPAVWARMEGVRWAALGTAVACWALLIVYFSMPDGMVPADIKDTVRDAQRVVYALLQWTAMLAACGFAHRHLNKADGPARRYLTQAVFPVYILHQTLIVVMAHALKPLKLNPGLEGMLLVVLTLTLSFAGVEIVRRVRWLRPLFGLGKQDEGAPAAKPVPQQAAAARATATGPVGAEPAATGAATPAAISAIA